MNELHRFRRRDPPRSKTLRVNARKFQQLLQEGHPFISHDITGLVMTFTETAATNKDAIRPCLQGLQDIMRRYRPGAHHPDDPDRCRILHSTDPSQVSRSICSPGAQKCNDLRSEILCHHKLPFKMKKFKIVSTLLIFNLHFAMTHKRPWPFQFGHRSVFL